MAATHQSINGDNAIIIGKDIDKNLLARVLISAERYACRLATTYIAEFVSSSIKRYSSVLTREQVKSVIDDIEANISGDDAGWNIDVNDWALLVSNLKQSYDLIGEDIIGGNNNSNMTISINDWQMLSCGAAIKYDMSVKSDKRNVTIKEYIGIIKSLPAPLAAQAKSLIASDIITTDRWIQLTHDPTAPSDFAPLRLIVGLPDSTTSGTSSQINYAATAEIGA